MKKPFILLEEVWVKVAFAEAGVYESERILEDRLPNHESIHQHAA